MPDISFQQAVHYTPARRGRGDIAYLVVHDMEAPEATDTAERVAAWFASRNAPRSSTHYNIDVDSIVQSVRDRDVAWCAPGVNRNGLHVEHAGYARQSRAEWLDDYGKAMLELSAWLFARKAAEFDIPVVKRDADDIRAGRPGIIGHVDATRAFNTAGGHSDPGANFPWDYFLARVTFHAQGKPAPRPRAPRIPDTTLPILRVDGLLGPKTIKAMQTVQEAKGFPITVDGKISRDSLLVRSAQQELRKAKVTCKHGRAVTVDGVGIGSNNNGRYPRSGSTHTLEACQLAAGWDRRDVDGHLSSPSGLVKQWQRDLNRGHFTFAN